VALPIPGQTAGEKKGAGTMGGLIKPFCTDHSSQSLLALMATSGLNGQQFSFTAYLT
jgi:hypothetical protein